MRLLILAVLLLTSLCAYSQDNRDFEIKRLVDAIEAKRIKDEIPGVGIALVSDSGPLWIGALGLADIDSKRTFTENTVFRIGSITKTFTALALLRLQEQGAIKLNDEVRQHVPSPPYENPWERKSPLRIVYLLEQTAGLRDLSEEEFSHNQSDPISLQDAFKVHPESRIIKWKPGLHHSYSNISPAIAAYVLEEVTQGTFEDYVGEEIFKPLGMKRSTFFLTDDIRPDLAAAYTKEGESIPYWHMIYRPFGAINSTLPEMSRFVQMLINKGKYKDRAIVTPASIEQMETVSTTLAARHGLHYGYGLGNYQWYQNGHLFHGHGGEAHGYISHFGYTRENNLGYFLIMNSAHSDALQEMRTLIENWIVSDAKKIVPPNAAQLKQAELAKIIGKYEQVTKRFPEDKNSQLLILTDGNNVYAQIDDASLDTLIPIAN